MSTDLDQWIPVAKLFGRLLVREIDDELLHVLQSEEISSALAELGLDTSLLRAEKTDDLAAEFFACFVCPTDHPPLVQSLCQDGRYESNAAVSMKKIAESAGVELDTELARGAPIDQLGVQLLLWAELAERSTSAEAFAKEHLAWAVKPLDQVAGGEGFYSGLSQVVKSFIELAAQE